MKTILVECGIIVKKESKKLAYIGDLVLKSFHAVQVLWGEMKESWLDDYPEIPESDFSDPLKEDRRIGTVIKCNDVTGGKWLVDPSIKGSRFTAEVRFETTEWGLEAELVKLWKGYGTK